MGIRMMHDFQTFWLHDEAAGARYLPVAARSPEEARHFVAWAGLDTARVISKDTAARSVVAPRPFLDVTAGWSGLARALNRAAEDPGRFGLMIGVDIGDVGVASISLGPNARAVWTSRAQEAADGADVRSLMESLGWRAVNEDIPVTRAVYGELDLDSEVKSWDVVYR